MNCNGRPIRMLIDPLKASLRRGNFSFKQNLLSQRLGDGRHQPNFIRYAINEFLTGSDTILDNPAVTGIKVYFAAYQLTTFNSDNNNYYVPENGNGLLTLVFAPTQFSISDPSNDMEDTGAYYCADVNGKLIQIAPSIANRWKMNYQTNILPLLNRFTPPEGDTKSLWFDKPSYREMIGEFKCIIDKGVKLIYVYAFFGVFNESEIERFIYKKTTVSLKVDRQLTLMFQPWEEIVIDGIKYLRVYQIDNPLDELKDDYDTGTPCPPSTACA